MAMARRHGAGTRQAFDMSFRYSLHGHPSEFALTFPEARHSFTQISHGFDSDFGSGETHLKGWSFGAGVNGMVLKVNGFADNFIVANPQFGTLNLITNDYSTNYHSLEAQTTLRPTHGLSLQSTYTWSKNLGTGGPFGLG